MWQLCQLSLLEVLPASGQVQQVELAVVHRSLRATTQPPGPNVAEPVRFLVDTPLPVVGLVVERSPEHSVGLENKNQTRYFFPVTAEYGANHLLAADDDLDLGGSQLLAVLHLGNVDDGPFRHIGHHCRLGRGAAGKHDGSCGEGDCCCKLFHGNLLLRHSAGWG